MVQAAALHIHRVLRAVLHPLTLTAMISQRGLEAEVFSGQIPFLLPCQQHQSTEDVGNRKTATTIYIKDKKLTPAATC